MKEAPNCSDCSFLYLHKAKHTEAERTAHKLSEQNRREMGPLESSELQFMQTGGPRAQLMSLKGLKA